MAKILFNTWSGAFLNPGGGEVQLLQTREALENKGYTIELYNQWSPATNFDIYHQFSVTHGLNFPLEFYKKIGKKIVVSPILWPPEDFIHWGAFYDFVRHLTFQADILLTNSHAESNRLSRMLNLDTNKFRKVRNGIASDFLNRKVSKSFKDTFRIQHPFVLSLANIDRRKNTKKLLAACASLKLNVVSIGHIRDEEYFNEAKQEFQNLIAIGPINDKDLIKSAYQECLLFALPSLCETPGIAALEAGSQGAKIVITSEGPTQEYFLDHVTYVSPDSVESIAKGIYDEINIKRNPNTIADFICENYTWEKAANDTIEAYASIQK